MIPRIITIYFLRSTLKKIFVLTVSLIAYIAAMAQPVAKFSANQTQGCIPTDIQFVNQSTGNATAYKWNFGDGTTSTQPFPLKTYTTSGIFTVTLIVSNTFGADTASAVNYITINASPIVDFSASPQKGCSPLNTSFNDLTTPGSGSNVSWAWNLGDGNTSTTQNPSHTYANTGTYDVSLVVVNSNGCSSSKPKTAFITVGDTVTSGFNYTMMPFCQLKSNPYQFTSPTSSSPLSYLWDFGDGTPTSTLSNPLHNYTTLGTFTVKLIASSSFGCSTTTIKSNLVKIDTIVTDFVLPVSVCPGSAVIFNNTSTPSSVNSTWNFGDGNTSNSFSPTNTYASAGSYSVVLSTSLPNGCSISKTKTLTVLAKPTVIFSADKTADCKTPFSVTFTSTTAGATNLQWDFGDGISGTGSPIVHSYTNMGIFTVKLVATNTNGCTDSLIKTNYIQLFAPTANINLASSSGCIPFSINPTASTNSADAVVGYLWNFGDGSPTSTSASPSHIYTIQGSYILNLTITTSGGCTYNVSQTITVGSTPISAPNISPNPVCARQPVVFSDLSASEKIDFWDFGDLSTSTLQTATHTYLLPGSYTIKYIVENNGCKKNGTLTNYVSVLPPVSHFTYSQFCTNAFMFAFNSSTSLNAISYFWDFGDAITNTSANPTHTYSTVGNFTVMLITKNLTCKDTTYQTITVSSSPTSFQTANTSLCKNNSNTFIGHYKTPTYVSAYLWDFGDGNSTSTTDSTVAHIYNTTGIFSVRLIVKNNFGCMDTVYKSNLITFNGPTAAFTVVNPTGCKNRFVTFNDKTKTDGRNAIVSWQWTFGDGSSQSYTAPPFTHTYTALGNYNVNLVILDAYGCQDFIQVTNAVTATIPDVTFTAIDTISCPMSKIQLFPNNLDTSTNYTWYTGTGQTVVGNTAYVSFPDSGTYFIKLVAKDKGGCSDSLLKNNYISIKKPVALFAESDSMTICSSLNIQFTNQSYYYKTLFWDFGNGTTSSQPNPFVNFSTGTYKVKLKITSPGGCSDSLTRMVNIYPNTHTLSYTPLVGCQPVHAKFKLSVPTKGTYVWDYNDGTSLATTDSNSTKTYVLFGSYVPRVTFKETSGCTVTYIGTDSITVYGVKANFGLFQQKLCGTQPENFTDSTVSTGAITYNWNFGDGSTSNKQSPSHIYAPGTYSPKLIVSSGACADTLVQTNAVIAFIKPNVVINGDSVGCASFTTSFTTTTILADTSSITYNWDFGNGQTSSLTIPPAQTYITAGTYIVKLHTISANGCLADTFKSIFVDRISQINAGNDTTVCFGVPAQLKASGTNNTYKWLPPTNNQLSCTTCANPIAKLINPITVFIVQDTSITGCIAVDSVIIKYLTPYTVTFKSAVDSLCSGLSVQLNAFGAQLYNWTPAATLNNATIANPIATPLFSTFYVLTATDTLGCQVFKDSLHIIAVPLPTINLGADTTIAGGSSLHFSPTASTDIVNYTWEPPFGLSCIHCAAPITTPKTTTTYNVTVSNLFGCTATDEITVTVLCSNNNVYFPNLFSPNGDGVNDVFYPRGTGLFKVKSFRIFNRGGQLLFSKNDFLPNDATQGWDGNAGGKHVLSDVYTYMAEIYCENNTLITINGNITVVY